jgi:hypothetical protein
MIESHRVQPHVEFDPNNAEHLQAAVLLFFHGRQHPILRFRIDPREQTNVREQMLKALLAHFIPQPVFEEASEYVASLKVQTSFVLYENTDNVIPKSDVKRPPVRKVKYG